MFPFRSLVLPLLLSTCVAAHAQTAEPAPGPTPQFKQAFTYSFPLNEMGRLRLNQLGDGKAPGRLRLGVWNHARKLADHTSRAVTAPNNDTFNSVAWLDLSAGPVKLSVPDTQGRYYSVAVIDAYTNNAAILGQRLTGTRAGDFLLVGPNWQEPLPAGSRVVRAPTNDVLLLARILVNGASDAAAVQALQDGLALTPVTPVAAKPAEALWGRALSVALPPAEQYVDVVNEMLARNAVPADEKQQLATLAQVGLCGAACSWNSLSPELKQQWTQNLPLLMADLRKYPAQLTPSTTGWNSPKPNLGNFGTDYAYRAYIALAGLLALEPAEAIYQTTRVDARKQAFNGANRYRLRIPAGGIPADAFWSMTLYQVEADGRLFFTENPIARFSIGDRTAGLQRNADGSLDILIQQAAPDAANAGNWLPAPASGPFMLSLRAYHPKAQMRDGQFALPAVEKLD